MSNSISMQKVRLLIIQYAGDYREAYHRLTNGGSENYYAQRYSIESAAQLGRTMDAIGVLCLQGSERFAEQLPNGVWAFCAAWNVQYPLSNTIDDVLDQFRPTHVAILTPNVMLINRCVRRDIEVLPMFADTFVNTNGNGIFLRRVLKRVKSKMLLYRLARILNQPEIRWISNHNLNASRNLAMIGVSPSKIVPWDWPPVVKPSDYPPKVRTNTDATWNLVFVGMVTDAKGVGDAVEVVAELHRRKYSIHLRIIGKGDDKKFQKQAKVSGVSNLIEFSGPQSHSEVLSAFRKADLALIPSRHEYPEGLPFTIYEALATRTPIVCTDHPAFIGRVGEGKCSRMVPQQTPIAIANAVIELLSDSAVYARMSEATAPVWEKLICPVNYYELIQRWISNSPDDNAWLSQYSLASGYYSKL